MWADSLGIVWKRCCCRALSPNCAKCQYFVTHIVQTHTSTGSTPFVQPMDLLPVPYSIISAGKIFPQEHGTEYNQRDRKQKPYYGKLDTHERGFKDGHGNAADGGRGDESENHPDIRSFAVKGVSHWKCHIEPPQRLCRPTRFRPHGLSDPIWCQNAFPRFPS